MHFFYSTTEKFAYFTGVLGVHCILLESLVSFSRTYCLVFCVSVAIKKIIFESTLANSKPGIRNSLLYGFYYFAHTKLSRDLGFLLQLCSPSTDPNPNPKTLCFPDFGSSSLHPVIPIRARGIWILKKLD